MILYYLLYANKKGKNKKSNLFAPVKHTKVKKQDSVFFNPRAKYKKGEY